MSLNTEPADPAERKQHHLPPKSYADAAEQGLDSDGSIDEDSIKESPLGCMHETTANQDHWARPVPGKSYADAASDGSPTSTGSGTYLRYSADGTGEQYEGQGMDEAPRSPTRDFRRAHKRVSSKNMNGDRKEANEGAQTKLVYEKFHNGDRLTSVKPSDDYEQNLRQDEREMPREQEKASSKDELVSGKRAGAGWEKSAIRWAPLNVPLQRRLQTGMVLAHTLSIALFLAAFFVLCAVPLLWPLLLPYLLYVLFSKAGTSGTLQYRSERLRRLPVWSLFASYFPARLHRSQPLPPTRKYVFGYHPHGIISHGAFAAFATEALGFGQLFPGITNTLLTLDSNFRIPLYRDYALRLGLASVSRESCENLLSKGGPNGEGMGRAITIVVGGARESLDAQPGALRLVLKRRKGFIKLAIRTGADLVPVLAFGENELYEQFDPTAHPRIHKFQLLVKKFMGFTVPLFHARGVFNYDVGMMPYRRPLNIVVGKPIMVERQERPDQAYVDEIHAQYVQELKRIWDEWKDVFAKRRTGELEIVE
ncbi:diacylglycerol O-acyltransferase 1 [Taxawa tesnikishii (nom. ined.)]|nr:diacylglycerol O-acyltransferase 1 [Dothideales sp. JES 119]